MRGLVRATDVVEADESDGTFVRLPSTMGIVTNIDPEHLEHYGSFENLRDAFVRYMQNIPFYGAGIVCLDHTEVQALVGQVQDRRIITYGLNEQADIQATNITTRGFAQEFDVICRDRQTDTQTVISNLHLPMAGTYNLQNAGGDCRRLEVRAEPEQIRAALSGFAGINVAFLMSARCATSIFLTTMLTIRSRLPLFWAAPAKRQADASSVSCSRIAIRDCVIFCRFL